MTFIEDTGNFHKGYPGHQSLKLAWELPILNLQNKWDRASLQQSNYIYIFQDLYFMLSTEAFHLFYSISLIKYTVYDTKVVTISMFIQGLTISIWFTYMPIGHMVLKF